MNLIVDIGNTSTKLAVFKGGNKISVSRINDLSCEEFEKKLTDRKLRKVIVSSVKRLPHFVTDLLVSHIPFVHILTYKSKFPFRIEYETPETLGTDRLAGVAGAYNLFPGEDILVADCVSRHGTGRDPIRSQLPRRRTPRRTRSQDGVALIKMATGRRNRLHPHPVSAKQNPLTSNGLV